MSRRYEWGAAGGPMPVPAGYVPGAEFREELGEHPSKPGNGALVIGDPYATAYVLEGTPAELRAYLAKLAALIPAEPPAGGVSGVPEVLEYEGHVKFADGTVISLQCLEGRCLECPDETPDGELADDDYMGKYGPGVLDGYDCEHGCGHGPAVDREAPDPDDGLIAGVAYGPDGYEAEEGVPGGTRESGRDFPASRLEAGRLLA